ncbi:MAG: hypothetical protein LBC12_00535 [Nitrososphaerota archaeon]|jgi:hypothetical protein|nr:hypothetical protein [Nitrososphaerota archaeon]
MHSKEFITQLQKALPPELEAIAVFRSENNQLLITFPNYNLTITEHDKIWATIKPLNGNMTINQTTNTPQYTIPLPPTPQQPTTTQPTTTPPTPQSDVPAPKTPPTTTTSVVSSEFNEEPSNIDYTKTPLEIIQQRKKQQLQQQQPQQQQETKNAPRPPPSSPQPHKHLSPIADFTAIYCTSCINPNGGSLPCSDFEQCTKAKPTLLIHKLITEINNLRTDIQKLWEPLINTFNPLTLQKIHNQTHPTTPHPTTPPPTTPTPNKQQTTNPPPTTPPLPPSKSVEQEEFFTDKMGRIWAKGTTSTGKYCERLYKHKNNKNSTNLQYYSNLVYRIETENQKKESDQKYQLGWDGCFWFMSKQDIAEPFIGRMPNKK